ncbi:hypothetical protein D6D12_03200 [Aureobasidium pullulans]|uniref:Uncharacterized protein n=1 Tax=Aureobasidium pullulans TaxID=5580 RepID=A0AB74JY92_AURPU|nr:hypothetical protein D6D12_03200 [Aureobasidium pullulans]THX42838.1 hypothetical protein D6D11_08192 [Aureobasidium pullulans]
MPTGNSLDLGRRFGQDTGGFIDHRGHHGVCLTGISVQKGSPKATVLFSTSVAYPVLSFFGGQQGMTCDFIQPSCGAPESCFRRIDMR